MRYSVLSKERSAFENFLVGQSFIKNYTSFHQSEDLESALAAFESSVQIDPEYASPVLSKGVVLDLMGRRDEAVDELESLTAQLTDTSQQITHLANFNLSVALFHGYSKPEVNKSEETVRKTLTFPKIDPILKTQCYALLAKIFVHRMNPSAKEMDNPDKSSASSRWWVNWYSGVARARCWLFWRKRNRDDWKNAMAMALNARACAPVFYSDYFSKSNLVLYRLKKSIKLLAKAGRIVPNDFATACNLGSVHMRIGILQKSDKDFQLAEQNLLDVTNFIRPGYGFALYELGRLYRVWGKFEKAEECQKNAKSISKDRNVSVERIDRELAYIKKESYQFP